MWFSLATNSPCRTEDSQIYDHLPALPRLELKEWTLSLLNMCECLSFTHVHLYSHASHIYTVFASWTASDYAAKAGLQLLILLPPKFLEERLAHPNPLIFKTYQGVRVFKEKTENMVFATLGNKPTLFPNGLVFP